MRQVWASMNLKGGVGKTTLSANICRALADLRPIKILLIDTDPQSSLTLIFKTEEEVNKIPESDTFYDMLCRSTPYIAQKVEHCKISVLANQESQIDLLPSHVQLIKPMIAAMAKGVNSGQSLSFGEMGSNFQALLNYVKQKYDLVVLDTNPSGNIATFLAIKHANYIIAPVTNDRFSIRGVSLMREVFVNEFDWLRREPFRLIPVINDVRDDRDAIRVRDQLHARAHGLGDQALIRHVPHSDFLKYNERKEGFAVDRKVSVLNRSKRDRLARNLSQVAEALAEKTRLWDEEE